jgi:hypothetical protein
MKTDGDSQTTWMTRFDKREAGCPQRERIDWLSELLGSIAGKT